VLAAVPQFLIDVGIFVGILTAVVGAVVATARSRPCRWLWHRNVKSPATHWLRTNVREEITSVVDPLEKRVWGIEKQVHPNGGASMPDRIEHLDRRCDDIEGRQVNMEGKLDELLRRPSRPVRRWPWYG
jgi:hypothetical protein